MKKALLTILCIVLGCNVWAEEVSFSVSSFDYSKFYSQKSFKGKVAIFSFVDVHCQHCQKEMNTIFSNYKDLSSESFVLRFISLSKQDDTQDFLDKKGYDAKYFGIINKNADTIKLLDKIGNTKHTLPYSVILNSDGSLCHKTWELLSKEKIKHILSTCK
jgi:cytochrome oxidase Cu insertion factor (SCO1/SenC/PrrC family)